MRNTSTTSTPAWSMTTAVERHQLDQMDSRGELRAWTEGGAA
jgi:hypothetical protein